MDHENCRVLLDSLSAYVDHDLSDDLCAEIERHMLSCENCRIVVNTLRKTVELYHETAQDVRAPSDVRQRLYVRLDLEEFLNKA